MHPSLSYCVSDLKLPVNEALSCRIAFSYAKVFEQKRDSSVKIDMKKGSGAHEILEDANAMEEEICETSEDEEERLEEVCHS